MDYEVKSVESINADGYDAIILISHNASVDASIPQQLREVIKETSDVCCFFSFVSFSLQFVSRNNKGNCINLKIYWQVLRSLYKSLILHIEICYHKTCLMMEMSYNFFYKKITF